MIFHIYTHTYIYIFIHIDRYLLQRSASSSAALASCFSRGYTQAEILADHMTNPKEGPGPVFGGSLLWVLRKNAVKTTRFLKEMVGRQS